MMIGYARVSKADGSQSLDLQRDALRAVGVDDDLPGTRQLRTRAPDGRRARRLEARPPPAATFAHLVNTTQDLCHDQSLLPLDFVRGGLFMETEVGYDTRVVVVGGRV